jgi:hypothetical protein
MVHALAAARTTPRPRRTRNPVTTITVNRETWRVAVRLAGGDVRRLRVIDQTTVVVRNH